MRVLAFCLALAGATAAADPIEVDVELALMVDVSRSMAGWELEIQRRGYAEALTSEPVLGAIAGGYVGAVAVAYVEWAGRGGQRVVVDWTIIDGPETAGAFAERLLSGFPGGMRRTSVSGAVAYGRRMIEENEFEGLRRVIDVSGDGPNNDGVPVTTARDEAVAAGMVVNGLPLMTHEADVNRWGIPDLDVYYVNCVIGGPGAFAIPVAAWEDFPLAVRRKLVLELAGETPDWIARDPDYDCLIGEKIRRQRDLIYGDP